MQADALQMQKIYVSQASLSENDGPASWAYSRRNNRYMGDLFSGASEFNCDYEKKLDRKKMFTIEHF